MEVATATAGGSEFESSALQFYKGSMQPCTDLTLGGDEAVVLQQEGLFGSVPV